MTFEMMQKLKICWAEFDDFTKKRKVLNYGDIQEIKFKIKNHIDKITKYRIFDIFIVIYMISSELTLFNVEIEWPLWT